MPDLSPYLLGFDNTPVLVSQRITGAALQSHLRLAMAEPHDDALRPLHTNLFSAFGSPVSGLVEKPYQFSSGVAIIPVTGLLLNRYPYCGNYACGYGAIRQLMTAALEDSDVNGILLDVNSFGGMAQGCFELSDFIYASRSEKPILAMVDASSLSAAYAIASSASKVSVIKSGDVGSVGVVAMHVDVSGALDQMGIDVTFIYAGKHKVDGNMYQPLSKAAKQEFQEAIDARYEEFVACVARNRNIDPQVVRDTEARIFGTEDALRLGLIDNVSTPISAFSAFCEEVTPINLTGDSDMSTAANTPAAAATAPAATPAPSPAPAAAPVAAAPAVDTAAVSTDAKNAERTRIKAIFALDEAKNRQDLANHLALTTELSVDACKGILMAAPIAAAPAAVVAPAKSPFDAAMANGNPEVTADGTAENASADVCNVERVLKNYTHATGRKLTAVK